MVIEQSFRISALNPVLLTGPRLLGTYLPADSPSASHTGLRSSLQLVHQLKSCLKLNSKSDFVNKDQLSAIVSSQPG